MDNSYFDGEGRATNSFSSLESFFFDQADSGREDAYLYSMTEEDAKKMGLVDKYKNSEECNHPFVTTMRKMDAALKDYTGGFSVFSNEGYRRIVKDANALEAFVNEIVDSEEMGLNGREDMKRHIRNVISNNARAVANTAPSIGGRRGTEGYGISALNSYTDNMNGGIAFALLGFLSQCKVMELYQINTEGKKGVYEFAYTLQKAYEPVTGTWIDMVQGIRTGKLADLFESPPLRPIVSIDNPYVLNPATLSGTVDETDKAKIGWIKANSTGDLIKGSKFNVEENTINDDVYIEEILYLHSYEKKTVEGVTSFDKEKPIYKSKRVFLQTYNSHGNQALRHFSGTSKFETVVEKDGELVPAIVRENILGYIHLDNGVFVLSTQNSGETTDVIYGDMRNFSSEIFPSCIVAFRLHATAVDSVNMRGSTRYTQEQFRYIMRTAYTKIASIPISPFAVTAFNESMGDDQLTYTAFMVNKMAYLYSASRELMGEIYLHRALDVDPQSLVTTPKYGAYSKLIRHDCSDIGSALGSDSIFDISQKILRDKIIRGTMDVTTFMNLPNTKNGQLAVALNWVFYMSEQMATAFTDIRTRNEPQSAGSSLSTSTKYGFRIMDAASYIDNLHRKVRIITDDNERNLHKEGIGVLTSADPEFPVLVYKPFMYRSFVGIDPRFDHLSSFLFYGRDGFHVLTSAFVRLSVINNGMDKYSMINRNMRQRITMTQAEFTKPTDNATSKLGGKWQVPADVENFETFLSKQNAEMDYVQELKDHTNYIQH